MIFKVCASYQKVPSTPTHVSNLVPSVNDVTGMKKAEATKQTVCTHHLWVLINMKQTQPSVKLLPPESSFSLFYSFSLVLIFLLSLFQCFLTPPPLCSPSLLGDTVMVDGGSIISAEYIIRSFISLNPEALKKKMNFYHLKGQSMEMRALSLLRRLLAKPHLLFVIYLHAVCVL